MSAIELILPQLAMMGANITADELRGCTTSKCSETDLLLEVPARRYDKGDLLDRMMGYLTPRLLLAAAEYTGQTRRFEPTVRVKESISQHEFIDGEYVVFGPFYNFSVLAQLEILLAKRIIDVIGISKILNTHYGVKNHGELSQSDIEYLRDAGIFMGWLYVLFGKSTKKIVYM